MTTTTTRSTADVRSEMREVRAEIESIERQWKSAKTRFNTYRVKHDYGVDGPYDEAGIERLAAGMSRNEEKINALEARLIPLQDRLDALVAEDKVAAEAERIAYRTRREERNAKIEAYISERLADIELADKWDLQAFYGGFEGCEVGWIQDYEGRDGKTYQRRIAVSVSAPSRRWSDTIAPAAINWSAWGSTAPDDGAERYGAAIIVASQIARLLDASGIVDEDR